MGKLDLLSVSLTVLGLVLATAALGSYFLIKGAARDEAAHEAVEWLENNMDKLISDETLRRAVLSERIILTLATQVQNHLYTDDSIDGDAADDIAGAYDNDDR